MHAIVWRAVNLDLLDYEYFGECFKYDIVLLEDVTLEGGVDSGDEDRLVLVLEFA